jgi:hypothetical protein
VTASPTHEVRHRVAHPKRRDTDRPAAGLIDALEELCEVSHVDDPERAGRKDEPEAVEEEHAERQQREEHEGRPETDWVVEPERADDDDDEAGDDVQHLPNLHIAQQEERLSILRLRTGSRASSCTVDEPLMLGWIVEWMTPPSRICTPTITISSDFQPVKRAVRGTRAARSGRPHRQQRLEDGDEEVRAILQLVHDAEPQVEEGEPDAPDQLPTAE